MISGVNLHSYVVEFVKGKLPSTDGGTQHLDVSCGTWDDESHHEIFRSLEGLLKKLGLCRVWEVNVGFRWVEFQICFLQQAVICINRLEDLFWGS
jgi:hypothetical protein